MRIRNILHKGLRKFVEKDDCSGLSAELIPKLRRMISFLQEMSIESELHSIPVWKAHQLQGERKGIWSLHVNKNWRLTFGIDGENIEIFDLNYEDYH
ncbi:MAG: type II toxin-antitoxin system RelE/ParE family toxin [Pseudomonadota bacterium]